MKGLRPERSGSCFGKSRRPGGECGVCTSVGAALARDGIDAIHVEDCGACIAGKPGSYGRAMKGLRPERSGSCPGAWPGTSRRPGGECGVCTSVGAALARDGIDAIHVEDCGACIAGKPGSYGRAMKGLRPERSGSCPGAWPGTSRRPGGECGVCTSVGAALARDGIDAIHVEDCGACIAGKPGSYGRAMEGLRPERSGSCPGAWPGTSRRPRGRTGCRACRPRACSWSSPGSRSPRRYGHCG
jgi:hypothetical protein